MRPQPALDRHRSINALAETINGLYKAEVIHRRGPWRNFEAIEFATLEWVDWFNNRRLIGAHRLHPAGRSRGTLLRHAERQSHGRVTQTKWPPAKPERFSTIAVGASGRSATVCMVSSRVGGSNLTLPKCRSLSSSPWDLEGELALGADVQNHRGTARRARRIRQALQ